MKIACTDLRSNRSKTGLFLAIAMMIGGTYSGQIRFSITRCQPFSLLAFLLRGLPRGSFWQEEERLTRYSVLIPNF